MHGRNAAAAAAKYDPFSAVKMKNVSYIAVDVGGDCLISQTKYKSIPFFYFAFSRQ